MSTLQRSVVTLLLLCLGCSAQSNSAPAINGAELNRRIERQVRAQYQFPPQVQITVGARRPAEDMPNYDVVIVTLSLGEHKNELQYLLSKDNKTLISWKKIDLSKDPYAEIMSKINTTARPWKGNPNAPVVLVNYDDFQCPFCARMHQTLLNDVFPRYADRVKLVYKDFPLPMHPWAIHAAVDANCLAAQNNDAYWAYANSVHASYSEIGGAGKALPVSFEELDRIAREQSGKFHLDVDKLNACLKAQDDSAVRASIHEADSLGVEATPTLFVNGYKLDGALPPEELRAAIDRALTDAGQAKVPASGQ